MVVGWRWRGVNVVTEVGLCSWLAFKTAINSCIYEKWFEISSTHLSFTSLSLLPIFLKVGFIFFSFNAVRCYQLTEILWISTF